jgi:quercetin dioxygenase-like cupin family protein
MATFIDTKELNVKEPREGWKGRFFHSPNITFAYYAESGAWIHEHSHPNDEVWNVIDGQLESLLRHWKTRRGERTPATRGLR